MSVGDLRLSAVSGSIIHLFSVPAPLSDLLAGSSAGFYFGRLGAARQVPKVASAAAILVGVVLVKSA
jgi:hypothetical protein